MEEEQVSATGGSARTQAVDADGRRWRTRRGTSLLIRSLAVLLPFAGAFVAGRFIADLVPHHGGIGGWLLWWGAIVLGSSVALVAVDRFARRLLPIAALYRLALVFPDRAPSRYRIALRTGTAHQLRERLENGGDLGDTPAEAAENLLALVSALGKHDRITRGHSERVRAYSDLIAAEMGLSDAEREKLHWAALVHDVGKMSVRPEILNKAGRPTDDEWQELRNHPAAAAAMVEPLRPWLGEWVDAATQHHERYDGQGYPHGLSGSDITLAGRIVAVADAYDCMTSARSYKKALPAEQARYELARNSGTQFDPDAVRALLGVSVGRLHLAGGPLSWLAQLPGAREAITLSGGGGAAVSSGVAAAAVTVAGAVGGVFVPPSDVEPVSAARVSPAPIEQVQADGASTAVDDDESGAPRVVVEVDDATPSEPDVTTTTSRSTSSVPSEPGAETTTTRPASGGTSATTTTMRSSGSPTTTRPPSGPSGPGATTTTAAPAQTTTTHAPTTTTAAPTTTVYNPPPSAVDDTLQVGTSTVTNISVKANDYDADGLVTGAVTIVSGPSTGKATALSDGRIRYEAPLLALATPVVIRYEVCDTRGACSQANVNITVKLLGLL